jgi:Holliday junction DNA helicase RuvB
MEHGQMERQTGTEADALVPTLDHVIGQRRAVDQLRTALDAYWEDHATRGHGQSSSLPPLLLVGPAGVGKSLLAGIVARELQGKLYEQLGQNILSPPLLQGFLMQAEAGEVLFMDEIHELHSLAQTTLYRALEESKLFVLSPSDGESHSVALPPFNFIGATTDEWALTKPLRDRFKLIIRLELYSDDELARIIMQRSRRLGWPLDEAVAVEIAKRGRGTPRIAIRLLEATRRVARAQGQNTITPVHFNRMVDLEGIDGLGLDPLQQQYLKELEGGPLRLNVLSTRLSMPRRTVVSVIEEELVRIGLVNRTEQGRTLTTMGYEHLQKTKQGFGVGQPPQPGQETSP